MLKGFYEWSHSLGALKGKEYFENYFIDKSYPWFTKFKFGRKPIVTLNRPRDGHHSLSKNVSS
jgi:hypothetical protein